MNKTSAQKTEPKPPRIDPSEPRFTTTEAAKRLHLSARKVKEKCCAGLIRATKPGKAWYIPESAIGEYLNARAN